MEKVIDGKTYEFVKDKELCISCKGCAFENRLDCVSINVKSCLDIGGIWKLKSSDTPAWLETLWNINPGIAERAQEDIKKMQSEVAKIHSEIQSLKSEIEKRNE